MPNATMRCSWPATATRHCACWPTRRSAEREVLGAIPYQRNEAMLHTDSRLMPRRRLAWACWNYHSIANREGPLALTYNMNMLQGLDTPETLLVTLNRSEMIDPDRVILRVPYDHPVFTPGIGGRAGATARTQRLPRHLLIAAPGGATAFTRMAWSAPSTPWRISSRIMHSALYIGQLRHRRLAPRRTRFPTRCTWCGSTWPSSTRCFAVAGSGPRGDARWPGSGVPITLATPASAWMKPCDVAWRSRWASAPQGPIRMLSQLRNYGHCFNPVTFYYCYDAADTRVETIVAEITNTPWRERHSYVLPVPAGDAGTACSSTCAKQLSRLALHADGYGVSLALHGALASGWPCTWRTCTAASGSSTRP